MVSTTGAQSRRRRASNVTREMESEGKSERLELRVAPEAKRLIAQAAALRGRSLSAFIAEAAQDRAAETIREERVLRLTVADTIRLADALANPPAPNAALREAMAEYRANVARHDDE